MFDILSSKSEKQAVPLGSAKMMLPLAELKDTGSGICLLKPKNVTGRNRGVFGKI